MGNPITVTLSSVGVSNAANCTWLNFQPITAAVTLGSTTMTVDFTVQFTLDDLQLSTSPVWLGIGSSVGSSVTHFSGANADTGISMTFLAPVAGLRISSTAISSSSLTLKVLQGG